MNPQSTGARFGSGMNSEMNLQNAGTGICIKQSPRKAHYNLLIASLIGAKFFKSIAIYILSSLLASTASLQVPGNGATATIKPYFESEEAFATNIHAPPVALFGRWSATIQILTFVQLSSGTIQLILDRLSLITEHSALLFPFWSMVSYNKCDHLDNQLPSLRRILDIFVHSFATTILLIMWVSALQLCGPFRTLLCIGSYEYTIAGIVSSCLISKSGSKLRGAALFAMGIVVLFFSENQTSSPRTSSHDFEHLDSQSKSMIGMCVLVIWISLTYIFSALNRKYSSETETQMKLQSTLVSGGGLLLLTFADFLEGADMIAFNLTSLLLTSVVALGLTTEYYVDAICTHKIEPRKAARIGSLSTLSSALIFYFIMRNSSHASMDLNPEGALGAFLMLSFAILNLTAPEKTTGQGSFVGYSADGLPLLSFSNVSSFDSSSVMETACSKLITWCNAIRKDMQTNVTSKRLFNLLMIHLLMAVIEFSYGASIWSSALLVDGAFKLFETLALVIVINSIVTSKMQPTKMNPLGYGRQEVLFAFVIAVIFLTMISSGLILISYGTILTFLFDNSRRSVDFNSVNESSTTQTLMVLTALLLLNAFGIYFTKMCHLDNPLFLTLKPRKGIYELMLSTIIRNTLLAASALLLLQSWKMPDFVGSMAISALSIRVLYSVLRTNARILLLPIPPDSEKDIQQVLLQILAMDGVLSYNDHRFWVHSPNLFVGSIHVHATNEANEQKIIHDVSGLFLAIGFTHFTVQIEKGQFIKVEIL